MTQAEQKNKKDSSTVSDAEWATRRLCSDGNCIGVVGGNGRCRECGLPCDGTAPMADDDGPSSDDDWQPEELDDAEAPGSDLSEADLPDPGLSTSSNEWNHRKLCRDGNCIGVIGPDGRCKECGLSWNSGKTE